MYIPSEETYYKAYKALAALASSAILNFYGLFWNAILESHPAFSLVERRATPVLKYWDNPDCKQGRKVTAESDQTSLMINKKKHIGKTKYKALRAEEKKLKKLGLKVVEKLLIDIDILWFSLVNPLFFLFANNIRSSLQQH